MTLIERFTQISIMIGPNHRTKVTEAEAGIMEDIAEEFAIDFAEWLVKKYDGIKSVKELLEIYKKEKEL
jgi:hypothetical protein